MSQPLCRFCGKKIQKRATLVVFNMGRGTFRAGSGRPEKPATKAEVQALFNEQVTHIRYAEEDGARYVSEAYLWDGESYMDKFFCKNDHATRFAYAALRYKPELGTQDYHKALEALKEKDQ